MGYGENVMIRNYSGFLNTFLVAPNRDTDGDGIIDENDPDDDGDELDDMAELTGSGFNPATPTDPLTVDTDADGAGDGAEAQAGTNPDDAASIFAILFSSRLGTTDVIGWRSRDGKQYEVLQADSVSNIMTTPVVVDTVTASGGVGPWFETVSTTTNVIPHPTNLAYRVRLLP